MAVLAPAPGEEWEIGTTREIRWAPGPVTGKGYLNLSTPAGQFNLSLVEDLSIGTGRWLWKVGTGGTGMQIPLGSNYQIRLFDGKGTLLGTSKGVFSLVAPSAKRMDAARTDLAGPAASAPVGHTANLPPGPMVQSVSPASAKPGEEVDLILTGTGFSADMTLNLGKDVALLGVPKLLSPDRVMVRVFIAPSAKAGGRTLQARKATGTAAGIARLEIIPALERAAVPAAKPSAAQAAIVPVTSRGSAATLPAPGTQVFTYGPFKVGPTGVQDDDNVRIDLNIKNNDSDTSRKTAAPEMHFRIQPLDGGACPGYAPGVPLIKQVKLHYELFGGEPDAYLVVDGARFSAGKYRLSASLAPSFAKPVVPDLEFTVLPTALTLFLLVPAEFEAGTTPQAFTLQGNGFHKGCKVMLQKDGEGASEATLKPLPANANPLHTLVAEAKFTSGNYQVWVRTADGKESAHRALKVIKPWIGAPMVSAVTPNPVRWDTEGVALNGGYQAILKLAGQGFTPAFWKGVTAEVQISAGKRPLQVTGAPDPYKPLEAGTLYLLLGKSDLGYEMVTTDGEILLHAPGNASVLVSVPSSQAGTLAGRPEILAPTQGQTFSLEPVPLELKHPSLPAGATLTFEWEFLPYGTGVYGQEIALPRQILATAKAGVGGKTSLIVPTQPFLDSGVYRFRVRVEGTNNPWSGQRVFTFIRPSAIKISK
jgi:hypothetical protein